MIVIIITITLFLLYSGVIFYYLTGWIQTKTFNADIYTPSTLISVIIPARNEENNIGGCIRSILSQSYPENLYEIIVVDDFSDDDTSSIVSSFASQNVSLISLKNYVDHPINSYKKKAIEIAIEQSKGELIVTTDADCIVSQDWLRTIAAFYQKYKPAFIAAPVAYTPGNNFLKIFQSLDFMMMQGITAAGVSNKFHNMCNGANLAYEKKAFLEVDGFVGINTIASGDDMLLMHKIYKLHSDRIMFLKSPDAIVQTQPMQTVSDFFNQRIRWASKADKYSDKKIIGVLFLVYFFNVWILLVGVYSFFNHTVFIWFAGLFIAKIIIELIFIYPVSNFFKKQNLLWWFPLAQPFHILYIIISGWLGKFGSYKWKGRRVK